MDKKLSCITALILSFLPAFAHATAENPLITFEKKALVSILNQLKKYDDFLTVSIYTKLPQYQACMTDDTWFWQDDQEKNCTIYFVEYLEPQMVGFDKAIDSLKEYVWTNRLERAIKENALPFTTSEDGQKILDPLFAAENPQVEIAATVIVQLNPFVTELRDISTLLRMAQRKEKAPKVEFLKSLNSYILEKDLIKSYYVPGIEKLAELARISK